MNKRHERLCYKNNNCKKREIAQLFYHQHNNSFKNLKEILKVPFKENLYKLLHTHIHSCRYVIKNIIDVTHR